MNNTFEITQEKIHTRSEQADEMAQIWERCDTPVQMYLKGCIATANALNVNKLVMNDKYD